MCGRYLFSAEQNAELTQIVKAVERRYGQNSVPQGEIRPTAVMPVLHEEHGRIQPVLQTWGYKLPTSLVINARAESVLEKPLFRDSIRQRRCMFQPPASTNGMRKSISISFSKGAIRRCIWLV